MKKLINSVSPFVLLLIPVLILVAFMGINKNPEIAASKKETFKIFKMPSVPEDSADQTNRVKFTGNSVGFFL